MKKQKELWHVKAFQKDGMGLLTLFCFDVMAQLTNIPAQSLFMSS